MTAIANALFAPAASRSVVRLGPRPRWAGADLPLGADTPFNLVQFADDRYRLIIAVPGCAESDLTIDQYPDALVITGNDVDGESRGSNRSHFHRFFRRVFALPGSARVTGTALSKGLLSIDLKADPSRTNEPVRVPIMHGKPGGTLSRLASRVRMFVRRLAAGIA